MKTTAPSTNLSGIDNKSLSGWNEAIFEAREQIKALKRSIRTFEELRDGGMPWPGTSEATEKTARALETPTAS